jgi:hypothetical protein
MKPKEKEPFVERLLSYEDLAKRWGLVVAVAKRRVRLDGIPIVRLNRMTVRVRLSDIEAFEARAVSQLPATFTDASKMRAARGKAKAEVAAK